MSEHQLITPRRNFLIRALGFTATGATISIPVLITDTVQERIDHHLGELTKLFQQQYPGVIFVSRSRDWKAWPGIVDAGDVVATIRAELRS